MMKKTDADNTPQQQVEQTLQDRKAQRDSAHSMELRNITALETIADELTQLRVHLTAKG